MGPRLAAFFGGANLVARLWHLARLPQPIMFSAVAPANHLVSAIARLASSFLCHFSPIQHTGPPAVAAQLSITAADFWCELKFRFQFAAE